MDRCYRSKEKGIGSNGKDLGGFPEEVTLARDLKQEF